MLTLAAQIDGEHRHRPRRNPPPSSRRQLNLGGGVVYGAAASGAGWTASVRPAYGHASTSMPGWWSGAVPRLPSRAFDVAPMLDAEVGFGDGERVSVSARRAFGLQAHPERGAAAGLGAVLRYARGW